MSAGMIIFLIAISACFGLLGLAAIYVEDEACKPENKKEDDND